MLMSTLTATESSTKTVCVCLCFSACLSTSSYWCSTEPCAKTLLLPVLFCQILETCRFLWVYTLASFLYSKTCFILLFSQRITYPGKLATFIFVLTQTQWIINTEMDMQLCFCAKDRNNPIPLKDHKVTEFWNSVSTRCFSDYNDFNHNRSKVIR